MARGALTARHSCFTPLLHADYWADSRSPPSQVAQQAAARQAAAAGGPRAAGIAAGSRRMAGSRQAARARWPLSVGRCAVSRRWHRTAVTSAGAPAADQLHCSNERRRSRHPRFDRGCTRRAAGGAQLPWPVGKGLLHSVPTCTAALVADGCRAAASDAFTCDWFGDGRCTQVKVALAAGLPATVTCSCPCSRLSVTRTTSART